MLGIFQKLQAHSKCCYAYAFITVSAYLKLSTDKYIHVKSAVTNALMPATKMNCEYRRFL